MDWRRKKAEWMRGLYNVTFLPIFHKLHLYFDMFLFEKCIPYVGYLIEI